MCLRQLISHTVSFVFQVLSVHYSYRYHDAAIGVTITQ